MLRERHSNRNPYDDRNTVDVMVTYDEAMVLEKKKNATNLQLPWGVALVRENEQVVRLARRDERVDEPSRVSEVHVLVDEAVHQH